MELIPLYPQASDSRHFKTLIFSLILSVIALTISFASEHFWNETPCRLCQLQRITYFLIFTFSTLGFSAYTNRIAISLVALCFVVSLGLAATHLAMQAGLIADMCAVPQSIKNLVDFKKMLANSIPCSKITVSFFGVPLSAYNMLFSLLYLGLFLKLSCTSIRSKSRLSEEAISC